MDLFKWSVFVLFAGQLLKLEIEARIPIAAVENAHHNATATSRWADAENETEAQHVDRIKTISTEPAVENAHHNATATIRWADAEPETEAQTVDRIKTISTERDASTPSDQRVVILPGPHKSASTSVQAYLVQLAKKGILKQHSWAWLGHTSSKGFSRIARHLFYEPEFEKNIENVDKFKQKAKEDWDEGNSLVIAAEFMDYVAALEDEDAKVAIGRLFDWLPFSGQQANQVEAVIMYRSPRVSHLVSAWKQQVQFHKSSSTLPWRESLVKKAISRKKFGKSPTLAEWLCHGTYPEAMTYDIETILSAQLSPFGVAHAYNKHGSANVTLIDLSGAPDSDVPSSVVCDILGLPCKNGKLSVGGIESSQKNHKSEKAELGMTEAHLAEAEELIRASDCYYYCLLGDNTNVLYGNDEVFQGGKMSREECCRSSEKKDEDANGKWMANQLIELGCRAIAESRATMK